ncbi:BRO-like protein [Desulfovibrio oxyclinae]|uniref:BRO-like protein n=1 Tax=Desulfovibrio oxyclinae TaxID=63560 RepID=UPI00036C1514|nr:BRO-like protein [Desulfovibrio oxyclinae]
MGSVIPFDFDGSAVRVVMREDEPWFVAKDVCGVLDIGNSRQAVSRLEEDEKGVITSDTLGGSQKVSAVSESGLYALIFTSRKPEARRFRKWVTSEVLPAIRKHGRYESCGTTGLPGDVPDFSLRLKPALRAQAMHTAVQTARLDGGSEQDVKRLYLEYCGLFCARGTADFETSDPSLTAFIEARCALGSRLMVTKDRLFSAYQEFCSEEDWPTLRRETFFREIRGMLDKIRVIRPRSHGRKRCVLGIGLMKK